MPTLTNEEREKLAKRQGKTRDSEQPDGVAPSLVFTVTLKQHRRKNPFYIPLFGGTGKTNRQYGNRGNHKLVHFLLVPKSLEQIELEKLYPWVDEKHIEVAISLAKMKLDYNQSQSLL